MRPFLSLYLDFFRFLLSLLVFLSHAYTGEIFWRLSTFSQPAVIAFFVLSGFVIAWVTQERETDSRTYLFARFARLYSVLLPCLLLTAVVDALGWQLFSRHYQQMLVRWLGAITFLLYLCHRPLLQFLSGFQLDTPGTWLQTGYLLGTTLLCAFLLTLFGSSLQQVLKNRLNARPILA